jgi:hypothetical protein
MAFAAQSDAAGEAPLESASHFFMKEAFAAPASGLPFLSTAFAAQSDAAAGAAAAVCANDAPTANTLPMISKFNLVMTMALLEQKMM